MTAQCELSRALYKAFRAALLLTGSAEAAEYAVLGGIAALDFGHIDDDVLVVETAKAVIQQRADVPIQSQPASSKLPPELQRLFLLTPTLRDCFMLRVLLGIPIGSCSRILHLGIEETREVLRAALQQLPFLASCGQPGAQLVGHRARTPWQNHVVNCLVHYF